MAKISRVLLSVTDKSGILEFASALASMGAELISTGGTARLLHAHGFSVVSELGLPSGRRADLVALDAAWEEEEVRFGPGAQGQGACGHEGLIAKLRHARRAVNPAPSSPQ